METQKYHRAKNWQLAFFALNNTATNAYMFLMAYISYYATGIAGLGVAIVGIISTATRLWDGVTDPIVGFFIDKTDGKFGKFRPFMVLGNIILAVMVLVIYGTTHFVPEQFRLVYYIVMYMIYIIGYTFQTACTKAGQACLTNDPEQRPQFTLYDTIFGSILWGVMPIVVSGPLLAWAGDMNHQYYMGFCAITIVFSGVLTLLAVIGIWEHDRTEFFAVAEEGQKLTVKDYWEVLKGNRAIQMLIVSAASDKLAATVKGSSVLMIVLFGCFLKDYTLYGTTSMILIVPNVIVAFFAIKAAAKSGMKKALVNFTIIDMVLCGGMLVIAVAGYVMGYDFSNLGVLGFLFCALYCCLYCAEAISGGIVIPMIADCSDYESARSGKYVPGMMGTLFSFIDKLISSLGTTIISLGLVAVGYSQVQPGPTDEMTSGLFIFLLVMYFGLPFIGWIANLIAMKFYPLDKEKMEEVQATIANMKK